MISIKNPETRGSWRSAWVVMLALFLAGCSPPGPRALLKGEKLIRQAKYAEAIQELRRATELLPKNAQAWNHLAIAYHGAGHITNAVIAYNRALALDRDLMTVHYNLGSLWLEQNNPNAAIEALNSYVMHPRHAADIAGWTKLGAAFMRAKRWDAAEKVFGYALQKLGARSPELLNNLGVIQVQRQRSADAAAWFNAALELQPDFGPALLNLATLYHQQPNSRALALRKYREYLALEPEPANWRAVSEIAEQLDSELNVLPLQPVTSNWVAKTVPPKPTDADRSQSPPKPAPPEKPDPAPAPSADAQSIPATAKTGPSSEPPPPKTIAKTDSAPEPAPAPAPAPPPKPPTPTAPAKTETAKAPPPKPAPTPGKRETPPPKVKAPDNELVIQPAPTPATPAASPPRTASRTSPSRTDPALANIGKPPPDEKKSLWAKLNPFDGKPGDGRSSPPARTTRSADPGSTVKAVPLPAIPRYPYQSPGKPLPGNHIAAQRFFAEGLKMQRAGQHAQAAGFYRRALELDPASFEAHYNLALVAYRLQDWKQALSACELALALEPESLEARHQLALSLRQAGYPHDAARELQTLLQSNPNEARVHLSLANLYAQQLNQPAMAREHYLKLLEHAPNHPQAPQVRRWVAAHP